MSHLRISPFRAFAMAFAILIGLLGVPTSGIAQTATPVTGIAGVTVTDLGTVVWPPVDPDDPDGLGRTLRLKRVDFAKGEEVWIPEHAHDGAFVLSVASGGVCYTYLDIDVDPDVEVTVTANVSPDDGTMPDGCESAQTDCPAPNGCELLPGETVYLTTGSTLTQSNTAFHMYGNVDADNAAVVYLAEDQPGENSAPCGGGCG